MTLDAAGKQLARCKKEPNHFDVSASPSCPWCQVEGATGVGDRAQLQEGCNRYIAFNRSSLGPAGAFLKEKKQLEALHAEWNSLPGRRAARLQELERDRFQQQLEQYLENFFIEHATIPGIGPGRKATLESYGIETAADVEKQRIVAVPGFGPAMAEKLIVAPRD